MPLITYFLTVGSLLLGLLYYVTDVVAPAPQPFPVTQAAGLPPPFKAAPLQVAEPIAEPAVVAAKVAVAQPAAHPPKAARKHKSTATAVHAPKQLRYADYPPYVNGNVW